MDKKLWLTRHYTFAEKNRRVLLKELLQTSLQELMEIEVVSKKKEPISTSPGIVTKIKMSEMEKIGVHTLREALNHIPGVLVIDGGLGNLIVTIRGVGEVFNQKVLFLLEGVPYYMTSHSDIPLLGIPVNMIEYIEVIRGPGAVMYGTNASAGVINIILKKDNDRSKTKIRGGGNGYSLINTDIDISIPLGTDGNFYIGTSMQKYLEGYKVYYPKARVHDHFQNDNLYWYQKLDGEYISLPTEGSIERIEEFYDLLFGIKYKNVELFGSAFFQNRTGLGSVLSLYMPLDARYWGALIHAKYNFEFDKWQISPYFDHNIMFIDFFIKNNNHIKGSNGNHDYIIIDDTHWLTNMTDGYQSFENPWKNNYRTRFGVNASYNISDNYNILIGLEYELRSNGRYLLYDDEKEEILQVAQPKGTVFEYAT
ncbi:hypothetical protein BVX93_00160, partial [bacterium B13(2017)]